MKSKTRDAKFVKRRRKEIYPSVTSAGGSPSRILVYAVIVAVLAGVPFALGRYMEFCSPDPFDSAANVYSAKHILDGAKIGVDEKPSAALGTLLVNILGVWIFGFSEFGPKLIQMVCQAAALVFMFYVMRRLFGVLAAAVGVIIASVYLSAPLIAKYGNVKEQYMIALMVAGVGCLVMRQLPAGKWWWAVLAGAFLSWAPLFKETGLSAAGAVGLFLIMQPLLKNRTWKQMLADLGLLLAGAVIALAPLYIWIMGWNIKLDLPYAFAWRILIPAKSTPQAEISGNYVTESWKLFNFSKQGMIVLRYYSLLILPVTLAAVAIVVRLVRLVGSMLGALEPRSRKNYERFVFLFGVWWLLDMAFVWISPRSYEQYYLPLNASAAMLGGYPIALYSDAVTASLEKGKWVTMGVVGVLCMIVMSWHMFLGIEKSPYSGMVYSGRQRGYVQRLGEIAGYRKGRLQYSWESVGDYIRQHSAQADKLYVWGWIPGIYLRAQRFCPAPNAFTSEMHVVSPANLSEMVAELLSAFKKEPPRFIVDTHNRHFPYDGRPPLELWPATPKGFLPPDNNIMEVYDTAYSNMLRQNVEPDEAMRYKAMKPFREFVMNNYSIAATFGEMVVFRLNTSVAGKGQQQK